MRLGLLGAALAVLAGCQPTADDPTPLQEPQSLRVHSDGTRLLDALGREVRLHGINVGGGAKRPSRPDLGSADARWLSEHDIDFHDRPFPLAEADAHWQRLRDWGFNFIRLAVTWEGIAHAGPDAIDTAYLAHIRALAEGAERHGLRVLVDMHQDVWSRATGGSGAPAWTLDAAGFDRTRLAETGAAALHAGDAAYRFLQWPTNHTRLATATMFTLFLDGARRAPSLTVEGRSIEDWLQDRYVAAWVALAEALAGVDAVIGYDLMNEPGEGYLGLDLREAWPAMLTLGPLPSPADSLYAATLPRTVPVYEPAGLGFSLAATTTLNPAGVSVWRQGMADPWRTAGVWTTAATEPILLLPLHFVDDGMSRGEQVGARLSALYGRLAERLLAVDPEVLLFVEAPQGHLHVPLPDGIDQRRIVWAPHWYDGLVMTRRVFDPELAVRTEPSVELVVGRNEVRRHVHAEFARLRRLGDAAQIPTVIGEFGLPFRPEDHASGYAGPTAALDLYLGAMEAETIGGALWHYDPTNNHAGGDHWNREDFSLIGRDDPDGRALAAIFRPRLVALAGREARSEWDRHSGIFTLTWRAQPGDRRATRIRLPAAWSTDSATINVVGARRCSAPSAEICLLAEDARPRLSIQLPPAM